MLRIAVPNKGALAEDATTMLTEAGYLPARESRKLSRTDPDNDVEFFFLRPRDIAVYVGEGIVDVGITGRDMLLDSGADADELTALGFGLSTFHYAGPAGQFGSVSQLDGKRIATSYPGLVRADLERNGVDARIVGLDGAVEIAIQLGVADAIADVVETGSTLRSAGLEIFGGPLMSSEGILIGRHGVPRTPAVDVLVRRLESVIVARSYVLIDFDCPVALLDEASKVTPGFESPTVSPLHDPSWVAVRSMVARDQSNKTMDALYALGARAILVTSIHACRM
ncbi:ATP phosphoribosyltransferase [Spelaeicoccus albus]|uniref:ATP phosphoribosyltransferase n=1 Tax=Spelaeicoccus albus TaxID=1280376 RepID=A0A7Z0D487_9MICO|nr:ATP phosphoribosyltransferase [Spelaeicoccus albus]NYI68592.1 ATP phosphoribosyltransferase [Spelaeicoccus albus]